MYGYGYRYNSGLVLSAGGGGGGFVNNYSLDFDGIDDYVQLGENNTDLQPTGAFSLSVWVKFDGLSGIQGIWEATSNVNVFGGDGYFIWKSSSNKFQFYMKQGTSWKIASGTTTVTTGTWYHILCTWDGSATSKIFINGIEEGSQSVTSINYNVNTGINLGGYQSESINKSYQIEGNIDEASLFNSVVNIADVWDGSGVPTDLSLLPTPPVAWYRNGDNGAYKSPQWLIPNNENFAANKVSNYSFDFDGIDDKIELGTQSLGITGAISVSAWVKIPTTNTGGASPFIQVIFGEETRYNPNRNWALFWRGGTNLNGFSAFIYDSSGVYTPVNSATPTPNDNQWHHLMFTYTGDTSTDGLKLFVDGVQIAQGTSANGGLRSISTVIPTIGGVSNSTQRMFEGNIDEVSIFNTDQSANVSTLYNGGEPTTISGAVAHYKMGEDATFSGGVWTVPDAVGSNNGTSANMTIEDRIGEAPNSENNAVSFNMDEVDRVTDVPT